VNGRAQSRENLSREWTQSNSAIDQAMSREILQNQQKYGAMIDDAQAKIGIATAEWQDAMAAVKRNAEERQNRIAAARGRTEEAAERTQEAARRAGVGGADRSTGSWSLRELQGALGTNDCERRTASAAESSVWLQQETNRYLKKIYSRQETAGLTYGG